MSIAPFAAQAAASPLLYRWMDWVMLWPSSAGPLAPTLTLPSAGDEFVKVSVLARQARQARATSDR